MEHILDLTGLTYLWGKIKSLLATGLSEKADKATTLSGYGITDAINTSSTAQTKAGNLTAAKFITSGGTSSQVVMGDGSLVDSKLLPQYEAYLEWGGKNFAASYGPIDAAMVSELGAPRTMFLKAAGIVVEYSTDGGSTWVDYGATDAAKVGLFSSGQIFYAGKNSTAGGGSANNMLRVSLRTGAASIYTNLNKFVIYVGTNGSTGCYCTIRCRTQQNYENNVDTWVTRADQVPINGWSGYNVINITPTPTYGNVKSSQYGEWQFIFGCTNFSGNYSGLTVSKIIGFGGVGWLTPSNMAKTGHLYSFDANQNATFPAQVQATSFKKTGGTSSQFLKADGSVDGTSYGTYSKPSGGIPKTDLATAVQTSLGKADTALQSFTETDPTVPAWAKQSTKPSYTAEEVGALPDDYTPPVTSVNGQTGAVNLTIPSAVTESTVSGWGFTKNTGTYSKPSGGIPKTDFASAVQTSLDKADTSYQKPSGGIPKADLASAVQTSLGKADTALQEHQSLANYYTKSQVDNLLVPANTTITVVSSLPASGSANTIYRVAGTNSYTDYGWDGTQFVALATYNTAYDAGGALS